MSVKLESIKRLEKKLHKLQQQYAYEQSPYKVGDFVRTKYFIFEVKKIVYISNKNGYRLCGVEVSQEDGTSDIFYGQYFGDDYSDFEILRR